MRGTVESVRKDLAGSVLRSGVSPSDTTLDVVDVSDFTDDDQPHQVKVGGTTLVYDSVTEDATGLGGVLNLTAAAGITKAAGTTRVDVFPKGFKIVAPTVLDGSRVSVDATVVHSLQKVKALPLGTEAAGTRVKIRRDGDALELYDIDGKEYELDAATGLAAGSALSTVIDPDDPGWVSLVLDIVAPYLGGGGGTGGVDIDCGNASATGVDIDCGVA